MQCPRQNLSIIIGILHLYLGAQLPFSKNMAFPGGGERVFIWS